MKQHTTITIVGAGPAGIGMGILLKKLGIDDFLILEGNQVGSTFYQWPDEMKLITPSFTGHGFGLLDLNAIAPETSPAYTYQKEHLSGKEYGEYLEMLADHYELPIYEEAMVTSVLKQRESFQLTINGEETISSTFLIWAAGEFQFPSAAGIRGSNHCIHSSKISSWKELKGEEFVIIGGYESGIDAAYHLVNNGKRVTLLSRSASWSSSDADPSRSLSPYTKERLQTIENSTLLRLVDGAEVAEVEKENEEGYHIRLTSGDVYTAAAKPILATGFQSGAMQLKDMFEWDGENVPRLTDKDESSITDNLFLAGPNVKHKNVIFCFIYKFRQRFAVVAKEISERAQIPIDSAVLEIYSRNNMLLEDLSCCEVKCEC
ncbi:SidA/IucD/PvdA family monooxygenase [Bacillus lacus]|uniref:SidA/IucD/PvdA family monooxygenase n=1 Tax=Metabacillus lacus TaxID=1983721 RepID=A0A7X2M0U2_9BACI|nr:NAD(P)/FAD-dependent oxidoreductase [Metabacillus lacus]MRX73249.1 SidA/IucD/PvdA family monooxygenase [Metabacillus lacus]